MKVKLLFQCQKILSFNTLRFVSTQTDGKTLLACDHSKIDFCNSEIAFSAKNTSEIVRALFVFKLCTFDWLVTNNKMVLDWTRRLLGERLFEFVMRKTVYGHFVAGVSHEDIGERVKLNRRYGVMSILDYSVEEDVSEQEAKEIVKETMEKVLDQRVTAPSALDVHYQTNLDFANRREKVIGARTYFFTGESQCDENVEIFKRCIDVSASTSNDGEGFTAVKLTALGPPQLLMHISDILKQLENIFEIFVAKDHHQTIPITHLKFDLDSFQNRLHELNIEISYDEQMHYFTLMDLNKDKTLDLFEWLNLKNFDYNLADIFKIKDPKTGVVKRLIKPLSKEGLEAMRHMLQRIDEIAQHAKQKNIRVMIDAEQSYLQPAIRRITMELMRMYNTEKCVIFNTYQCYLKEAYDNLSQDLHFAEIEKFYFGAKLVRGAYMDQERERACLQKYDDPINPTFEVTTTMYYQCMEAAFNSIKTRPRGEVQVMIASHNPETVKHAIAKLHEYEINPKEKVISFGQLLGMCDHITFTLGHMGYSVYKYMPYGPVNEVLPYLSRRALENRAVIAKCGDEQQLLRQELFRRIKNGTIFHSSK